MFCKEVTMMEQWVNISWTYNVYAASSEGRIKSNECPRKDGRICKETILKTWIGNHGYQTVALRVNGKYKRCTVHSLVAECFLGVKPKGTEIDHIDGNKQNNAANNLQYITRSENLLKYYNSPLWSEERRAHKKEIASQIGRTVVREATRKPVMQFDLKGNYIQTFESVIDAANSVNLSKDSSVTISRCCNGRQKTSRGYQWKWAEKSVTTSSNERKKIGENPSSEKQDSDDIV